MSNLIAGADESGAERLSSSLARQKFVLHWKSSEKNTVVMRVSLYLLGFTERATERDVEDLACLASILLVRW